MTARSALFAPLLLLVLTFSLFFLSTEAASSQDAAASVEEPSLGVAEAPSPAEQKAEGFMQEESVQIERHAAPKAAAKSNKQLNASLPLILAAITFILLVSGRAVRLALATEKAEGKETPEATEASTTRKDTL
ncbi:hypothetical protein Emed_006815 [Eimeria media]